MEAISIKEVFWLRRDHEQNSVETIYVQDCPEGIV
jgi:hypothetical protein